MKREDKLIHQLDPEWEETRRSMGVVPWLFGTVAVALGIVVYALFRLAG